MSHLADVRQQYEKYPFPMRRAEDERQRLIVSELDHLRKIDHHCFGGCRDFDKPLRVLIAGGGTGDALIFLAEQLRSSPAEFVFVDFSEASLEVAKARAKVRGFKNVTWIHGSLLDLQSEQLGLFDYINCVGVLHHLVDPAAGLAVLKSLLAPGGGMGLMLYGKYGRSKVYLVQQLLNLMGGEELELEQRVEGARKTLSSLIRSGVLKSDDGMLAVIENPEAASYLVDTYLHGQDRSYSVSDIHELLESADLQLAGFTNFFEHQGQTCALEYDPHLFFIDQQQRALLDSLPAHRKAHIAELLGGCTSMHALYVAQHRLPSALPLDQEQMPCYSTGYARDALEGILREGLERVPLKLNCGIVNSLEMTEISRYVLGRVGQGIRTGQILADVESLAPDLEPRQVQEAVVSLLDLLIRLGLVCLRLHGLPPLPMHLSKRVWNGAIDLRAFELIRKESEGQ